MSGVSEPRTHASLLLRLALDPVDQAAWSEFVDSYGARIYQWCRQYTSQEADALDVTQTVLLKLAVEMKKFRYDQTKSFRGWLKTLTHNAWYQFVTSRQSATQTQSSNGAEERLRSLEARDDLVSRLEQQFNLELVEEASKRVQRRVAPRTWKAFQLLCYEGLSGTEAAHQLKMKVANVFVAKSRVQKLLQEELRGLERSDET
jgi:RNA polymerase sigma-70 factor (ECF subfamily)